MPSLQSKNIQIIKDDGGFAEMIRTLHYGLKQINEEDDLNKVIDWDHSDLKKHRKELNT